MEKKNIIAILLIAALLIFAAVNEYNRNKARENYTPTVLIIGNTNSALEGERFVLIDQDNYALFNGSTLEDVTADYLVWINNGKLMQKNANYFALEDKVDYANASYAWIFEPISETDREDDVLQLGKGYLLIDERSYYALQGFSLEKVLNEYLRYIRSDGKYSNASGNQLLSNYFRYDRGHSRNKGTFSYHIKGKQVAFTIYENSYNFRFRTGRVKQYAAVDSDLQTTFHGVSLSGTLWKYWTWKKAQLEAKNGTNP